MSMPRSLAALSVILTATGMRRQGHRLPASEAAPLRRTLQVGAPPGQPLSYLQSGDERGVTVIYVHGTPGSAEGWIDYLMEPVPGSCSLALDRPGFGHSGPRDALTRITDQAAAVLALMPADGRQVVLVGHSLGGAVVTRVAAEQPQRVAGLVLLASSLDPAQEVIHALQPLGRMWPVRPLLPRAMRNANDELIGFKAELQELQPLLHRVTAPTVIVHGTHDTLVPFANVAYIQTQLRGARSMRLVELAGQNHFLPWNSEPAVRDAVRWAMQTGCPAS